VTHNARRSLPRLSLKLQPGYVRKCFDSFRPWAW
jgi:hypothetical protein